MGAHIFISYAREDVGRVKRYYKQFRENGFDPWMDGVSLRAGQDWDREIKESIRLSDIVIFFISRNANRNDGYFQREILHVLEILKSPGRQMTVIPACLNDCPLPVGLERLQKANLYEKGGWKKLVRDISNLTNKTQAEVHRARNLSIGTNTIDLPCFFPAISSTAKSTLSVIDHLALLISFKQPNFLISAFDIHDLLKRNQQTSRAVMDLIYKAYGGKSIILLDSGNYEKYWRKLKRGWTARKFIEVFRYLPIELAFCYDNLKPSEDRDQVIREIEKSLRRDQKSTSLQYILPIVHSKDSKHVPYICQEVVSHLKPLLIAVPERELGEGIFKRAETIVAIRKALDSTGAYYPLHILGTGNPLSILLFAACGADSFDGLEWCQTSVDKDTGRLYHSQLADLFLHQSQFGKTEGLGFAAKALMHNLTFYHEWMRMIRVNVEKGNLPDMLKKYFPQRAFDELKGRFPEVLKV